MADHVVRKVYGIQRRAAELVEQCLLAGGELCAILRGLLKDRLEGPEDNKAVLAGWFCGLGQWTKGTKIGLCRGGKSNLLCSFLVSDF